MVLMALFWLVKGILNGSDNEMKFKENKNTFKWIPQKIIEISFVQIWYTVISQNGTSPSECWHSPCRYTKGQFGLKWPKLYRCAWTLMHYLHTSLIYFYSKFWDAYTTMYIATYVSYAPMCIATHVYLTYVSFLWATYVSYAPCLY